MCVAFFLVVMTLFGSKSATAETVLLKDGSVLRGTIKKADAEGVEIETQDGTLQIKKERIEKIDYTGSQSAAVIIPPITPVQIWQPDPILERHNEISFHLGGFTPSARLRIDGEDDIASSGIVYGGRYLRQTSPHSAFGVGIEKIDPVMHNSETLINHAFTTSRFESLTFMGLAKLSTTGNFRAYAMGGLGFHSTTLTIDALPSPGFGWSDTNTTESRNLVNSTKTAAISMLQIGIDADIGETFSSGLELAYYHLGASIYDASPAAQKQFGLTGINQAFSGASFAGHFSARF